MRGVESRASKPTIREVPIAAFNALPSGWTDGFEISVSPIQVSFVPKSRTRPVWRIGLPVDRVLVAPKNTRVTAISTETDVIMQLLDSQQVVLSVSGKDKAGNEVPIPGNLSWTVSDPDVAELVDNEDGSFTLVTTGELGSVVVTVSDDMEGDGDVDFIGSLAVDVVAGAVNEIVVSAAEPTDR